MASTFPSQMRPVTVLPAVGMTDVEDLPGNGIALLYDQQNDQPEGI